VESLGVAPDLDEVVAWCESGLLALCGAPGRPAMPPTGLVGRLDDLARRIGRVAAALGARLEVDWGELVLGRAALRGFEPRGRTSANGSCRLLATLDGHVALNLPRPDDLAALEALVEGPVGEDHWASLEGWAAARPTEEVAERTRLLHLAAGTLGDGRGEPVVATALSARRPPRPLEDLVVVDLSSMWAGPLCAALLMACGARVVKVESRARPDGARFDEAFYSWLHPDDQPVEVLDVGTPQGRRQLAARLATADVVLESSRPRALSQLGCSPEHLELTEGVVWASITARGPADPMAVGFGDDAAVAGGLVAREATGAPVFCGDAIADPLSGMLAASEVLESLGRGGGEHLAVSMSAAAGSMVPDAPHGTPVDLHVETVDGGACCVVEGRRVPIRRPARPTRLV
jgi:CoA-transferase family III